MIIAFLPDNLFNAVACTPAVTRLRNALTRYSYKLGMNIASILNYILYAISEFLMLHLYGQSLIILSGFFFFFKV